MKARLSEEKLQVLKLGLSRIQSVVKDKMPAVTSLIRVWPKVPERFQEETTFLPVVYY